ncbi:BTB/POZ protein [Camillea tinctor]|nr:BTB/POZ protein [Camillea tinctor]
MVITMNTSSSLELIPFLKELYLDEKYSDLTIICGTQSRKVHKAIVCPRSKFFAAACDNKDFKEGRTGIIELPDDDPRIVDLMIYYFYHLTYHINCPKNQKQSDDYSTDDYSTDETIIPPKTSDILTHAKVYSLAEKYLIEGLKKLAFERFKTAIETNWDFQDFRDAIWEVYTSTVDADKGLRDIIVATLWKRPWMLGKKEIQDLLKELGSLSFDLLMHIYRMERWGPYTTEADDPAVRQMRVKKY